MPGWSRPERRARAPGLPRGPCTAERCRLCARQQRSGGGCGRVCGIPRKGRRCHARILRRAERRLRQRQRLLDRVSRERVVTCLANTGAARIQGAERAPRPGPGGQQAVRRARSPAHAPGGSLWELGSQLAQHANLRRHKAGAARALCAPTGAARISIIQGGVPLRRDRPRRRCARVWGRASSRSRSAASHAARQASSRRRASPAAAAAARRSARPPPARDAPGASGAQRAPATGDPGPVRGFQSHIKPIRLAYQCSTPRVGLQRGSLGAGESTACQEVGFSMSRQHAPLCHCQ
jgi:hypothetical protein